METTSGTRLIAGLATVAAFFAILALGASILAIRTVRDRGTVAAAGQITTAGEQGPAGTNGERGEKGDTGPAGAQGKQGAAGPQGRSGIVAENGEWAYVHATKPNTPLYEPEDKYQAQSNGQKASVARIALGHWRVTMPGLTTEGGMIQVTSGAVAGDSRFCTASSLQVVGSSKVVDVWCRNSTNGQPAVMLFWLLYVN